MKNLALLTLALIVAGAAQAEGSSGEDDYNLQNRNVPASTLTRAEVQAEYLRAAAAGEIQNGEDVTMYVINQQAGSSRDVGAVRAEAVEAARSHTQDVA
jgi:hypothetical protein